MDIKSAQAKGFGGDGGKQYTVENDITPLKNRVLVSDMHFGETKSKGGIIIVDDDGTADGCDETADGDVTLSIEVTGEGSADVNYSSNVDVYGFQFDVSGVAVTGAYRYAGVLFMVYCQINSDDRVTSCGVAYGIRIDA